ncbi:DUF1343 domain-containing protein [candidate division KSB1 bacterium]|nr:DUF1343 domain-containing protein [candidate division KSB1 bacterium]
MKKIFAIVLLAIMLLLTCRSSQYQPSPPETAHIKPGIEVLLDSQRNLAANKRVGLITNATGITSDFTTTIDALFQAPDIELVALFGPEHGVRGDIPAGDVVPQYTDPVTGVPVYSLYGQTREPTPEMLENLDILMYDIQDIGSRGYTYIYTMAYAMEAAEENDIPFIVLDRPNPLGGNRVEGNVLEPEFSSFIGLYPIPYVYGMTVGELAKLFNTEFDINCNLTVVPMEGWERDMLYDDTGLPWVPTSPHVPHSSTPIFVAATGCIGELNTVSIGVGYTSPFELIGAPWINENEYAKELNDKKLPGVHFRPMTFKPFYFHFTNELCRGIQIHITDKDIFSPSRTQLYLLSTLYNLHPDNDIFDTPRISSFDKAYGTDQVREAIVNGIPVENILSSWNVDLDKFNIIRSKYLIYP